MKDTWLTYFKRHFRFESLLGDADTPLASRQTFNQFRLPAYKRLALFFLKFGHWICLAGFVAGLTLTVWPGGSLAGWAQEHQTFLQALIAVSVSGLIGYGTNYLAIRMLFQPVEKRPIWGQGLIPSQRERIVQSLAKGMHENILSQELIRNRIEKTGLVRKITEITLSGAVSLLHDESLRQEIKDALHQSLSDFTQQPAFRKEITGLIDEQLELSMSGGVKRFVLQTYKRLNKDDYESTIDRVITAIPQVTLDAMQRLESEVDTLSGKIISQQASLEAGLMQLLVDVLDRLDIADILAKQMEHFDEGKLERMIWEATNEQLLYIQNLGTFLGVLGGFLIWKPVEAGIAYAVLLSAMWLLDMAIYNFQKRQAPPTPSN